MVVQGGGDPSISSFVRATILASRVGGVNRVMAHSGADAVGVVGDGRPKMNLPATTRAG